MSACIEKLALCTPVVASCGVFAPRRIVRGIDAMDDNHPLYGTANLVIAGGQTLKGIRAAEDLTKTAHITSASDSINAMSNAFKGFTESSKFFKLFSKVLNFASDNVNPLICAAGAIKVLGSDDKADAASREILGLGTMFGFEYAAKRILGMPYKALHLDGTSEMVAREALYHKNPFIEKQVKAFEDYCSTAKLFKKISLASVPGALKGIFFVIASITGYKLGGKIASCLLGKDECKTSKNSCKRVVMDNNSQQTIGAANAA